MIIIGSSSLYLGVANKSKKVLNAPAHLGVLRWTGGLSGLTEGVWNSNTIWSFEILVNVVFILFSLSSNTHPFIIYVELVLPKFFDISFLACSSWISSLKANKSWSWFTAKTRKFDTIFFFFFLIFCFSFVRESKIFFGNPDRSFKSNSVILSLNILFIFSLSDMWPASTIAHSCFLPRPNFFDNICTLSRVFISVSRVCKSNVIPALMITCSDSPISEISSSKSFR